MRSSQWIFAGIAGAVLFVAGASTPVGETEGERYYREAFVQNQWPKDFRPNVALTTKCDTNAGALELRLLDLAASPPQKLATVPRQMQPVMKYAHACYTYFVVSSNPQHPGKAFAAVVLDSQGRLVKGAGGTASNEMAEDGYSWMWLAKGYTAFVQTNKNSRAPEMKPGDHGEINPPLLPRS